LATLSDRTKLMDDDVRAQLIQEVRTEISQLSEDTEFEVTPTAKRAVEAAKVITESVRNPGGVPATEPPGGEVEMAQQATEVSKWLVDQGAKKAPPKDENIRASIKKFGLEKTIQRLLEVL